MSLQEKCKHDSEKIMRFIESHPKFDAIYRAFMKGPDPQSGFMWTTTEWWTQAEGEAIEIVSNKVLEYGWDSSGYGFMMRIIQDKIKELPVATAHAVQDNSLDSEKKFAKSYQQTSFGKAMDDNNKKALDVMAKKGADGAAYYMMAQAGGNYARMRSMFG